jgi:hypothetical protein
VAKERGRCGLLSPARAERIAERKARAESNTMSESEELSKNALKKKLKAEEAAKKKAVKDAEKAAKAVDAPKKEKLGGDEVEYDPTQYYENRLRTVNNLGVSTSHSPITLTDPASSPLLILTNSKQHIRLKSISHNTMAWKMVLTFKIH